MSDNPRRWFKLHPVTAIVLLLVANGIVWLNVQEDAILAGHFSYAMGWPWWFFHTDYFLNHGPGAVRQTSLVGHFEWNTALYNLITALVILRATAVFCEWLIRKRRFQIHLSTAIVLMFAAGGLLALNMRAHEPRTREGHIESANSSSGRDVNYIDTSIDRGWPYVCHTTYQYSGDWTDRGAYWGDKLDTAKNVVIALGILAAVASVCEWLLHRREARKP